MRFGGLKDVLRALPAAGQGVMQGMETRAKWDQAAADAAYKRSQLEYLNKKAAQDALQGQADLYEKGLVIQDGKPGFDPELLNPESNASKARANYYRLQREKTWGPKGSESISGEDLKALETGDITGKNFPSNVVASYLNRGGKQVAAPNEAQINDYMSAKGIPANKREQAMQEIAGMSGKDVASFAERIRNRGAANDRFKTGLDTRTNENLEDEVQKLSAAYTKAKFPSLISKAEALDKETGILSKDVSNIKKGNIPGFWTNAVRGTIGDTAAGGVAAAYGGGRVNSLITDLLAIESNQLYGTAQTKFENAKSQLARGMGMGGKEEDVIAGLKGMVEGLKENEKALLGGYRPEVVKRFKSRYDTDKSFPVEQNPSQKRASKVGAPTGTDLPDARKKTSSKPPVKQGNNIYYWNEEKQKYE